MVGMGKLGKSLKYLIFCKLLGKIKIDQGVPEGQNYSVRVFLPEPSFFHDAKRQLYIVK